MKNLFFISLFLPISIWAKSNAHGTVTILKGSPQIQNASGVKKDLHKGDQISESDTIITTAKSVVRIVMMDSNVIDVYPNSQLLIKKYIYKPKEDEKNVQLEVTRGKIKSTVRQKYDNDKNKFNVKTPVIVAGVRGTVFTTNHDVESGNSRITTQEGRVEVQKIDVNEQSKEFFTVNKNQTLQVDQKTEKPEVQDLNKKEINQEILSDKKQGLDPIESKELKDKKEDQFDKNKNGPDIDKKNDPKSDRPAAADPNSTLNDQIKGATDDINKQNQLPPPPTTFDPNNPNGKK
jgi:hypothetical protein